MNPTWFPQGLQPLKTQVAGHTFLENTDSLGLLQGDDTSCVLKPLGKPSCAERELAFYTNLQKTKDPILLPLRSLVPHFYDHVKLNFNHREVAFLKLENLTYNMCKPCVMDIKIGKRTWDPEASPKKRQVEEQKYIKCKQQLGLCIPGFQVYKRGSDILLRHGKDYGKKLDVEGFKHTMQIFLNLNGESTQDILLTQEVLRQLYCIRDWFSKQNCLHFYASSVLIAYDFDRLYNEKLLHTNGNKQETVTGELHKAPWIRVRMIDFAHVFPAENAALDDNYIFGLQNLIQILEEFLPPS